MVVLRRARRSLEYRARVRVRRRKLKDVRTLKVRVLEWRQAEGCGG